MRILTFISSLSLKSGGPSRSVPMLVKGLAQEGVNVTLMTIRSHDMNIHAIEGTSAKLKILEEDYSIGELETYVISEKFDLIQIQSVWDLNYHKLCKVARKYNIPYIITPRGMLEPWSLSQKRWKKKLAWCLYQGKDIKKAACVFTTSKLEAEHVRALGVNVPISVIPNGIETDGYVCRISNDMVKEQVLFLSRIHKKKGIELLIDAWANLIPGYCGWQLIIVGDGDFDYIETLKTRINGLGLEDSVQIKGPVYGNAKVKLYQESTIFCLPSYSENFGMVIAEAMSCGVPVITTTNCPWEMLNETDTGWCIDLKVEVLEKTLQEAMSLSPARLFEMGQKGRSLISENFNYRSVANKTKILYEWLLNGGEKPIFVQ